MEGLETDRVYQALFYAAHELHGFFAHFGVLDEKGEELRCFPASGRVTRTGLPPKLQELCEQRVREAKGSGTAGGRVDLLCAVKVKSVAMDDRSGKARIELVLVPARKLVILDLNGVLCNRYPVGDPRRISKEVRKRPGCDAFLDFCFAHFDVAAWSCCRKETMELGLFGDRQRELVFVHHSAHSTNLWPRHSVVSPAKPLFLKQLPKLWATYDRVTYDASNTILIDNHVEKFEGNPLGSCVVVPDYDDDGEPPDALLAPDGELTRHLAAMAAAPDSGAYVRGTPSPFFPTEHPEPPLEVGPLLKRAVLEAVCASEVMRREMPELTVQHYMERHETPGPRAIQLRRKTLGEVVKAPHVVCEKSDGTRLFLFLPDAALQAELARAKAPGNGAAYLVDRHWGVEALDDESHALRAALSPGGRPTLLDGELIESYTGGDDSIGGGEGKPLLFLIFDVVIVDGEDVGAEPVLAARMDRLKAALGGPKPASPLTVPFGPSRPGATVTLVPKAFHALSDLRELVATSLRPKEDADGIGDGNGDFVWDDGARRSLSDGLVFTPARRPYYLYQVHKYKTPGRISVDFKVKLADLCPPAAKAAAAAAPAAAPLYLSVSKHDTKFTDLDLRRPFVVRGGGDGTEAVSTAQALRDHMEANGLGECIVECDLLRRTGLWALRHLRADKQNPNSLQVCWNNLEAVAEGLELPELVDALEAAILHRAAGGGKDDDYDEEQGGQADAGTGGGGGGARDDDVAAHYDELQQRRWREAEEALDPRIHNLRRLNNWIKSVLIEACCSGGSLESDAGADEARIGFLPNPLATVDQREAAAAAAAAAGKEEAPAPFSVLDVACGRGGDFKKWALQGAEVYVGVDVSAQSVAECRARVEEHRRRAGGGGGGGRQPQLRVGAVLVRSMMDPELPAAVARAVGDAAPPVFDVVSVQFALHYACGSEADLAQLLRNVDQLLAPEGATLLVTSVDARALRSHLRQPSPDAAAAAAGAAAFGNAVYRVELSPEAAAAAPALAGTGLRYTFTLASAVEACDEYVVDLPTLTRLAHEVAGLTLVSHTNFGSLVHGQLPAYGHLLGPLKVGTVSAEEWEAIQLYSALVFRR